MEKSTESMPVACAPFALTTAERARSRELREALGAAVDQVEETPTGYTYQFRTAEVFRLLAEWIPLERRCCPFLSFDVRWRPGDAQPVLALSGPEGTKAFLQAELPELPRRE